MIDKSIYIFTRLSGNKLYQFKKKVAKKFGQFKKLLYLCSVK